MAAMIAYMEQTFPAKFLHGWLWDASLHAQCLMNLRKLLQGPIQTSLLLSGDVVLTAS